MSTIYHVLSVFPCDCMSICGEKEKGREGKAGRGVARIRMRMSVCVCVSTYTHAKCALRTCQC